MIRLMRKVFAAIAATTIALAVSAASAAPQVELAKTRTTTVGDDFFNPTSLAIKQNDKIVWDWVATERRHNVKVRSGPVSFSSKTRSSASYSYSHVFRKTGTYKLYCSRHPDDMKQTVRVKR